MRSVSLICTEPGQALVHNVAERYTELFGVRRFSIDRHYTMRAHGLTNQSVCNSLQYLSKEKPGWWKRGFNESDTKYNSSIAKEGGSGSVMRAWPLGLIFAHDYETLRWCADEQSQITHRHPMARAASVALSVGIAEIIKNPYLHPTAVVERMVSEASVYKKYEKNYKNLRTTFPEWSPDLIRDDKLSTSDMLAYAIHCHKNDKQPNEVLGYRNVKEANYRSTDGALLGWAADEALAAAVYIFLRHPDNLHEALIEAVNTPGDSDSIATITGALVGARTGWKSFLQKKIDVSALENYQELRSLAMEAATIIA